MNLLIIGFACGYASHHFYLRYLRWAAWRSHTPQWKKDLNRQGWK